VRAALAGVLCGAAVILASPACAAGAGFTPVEVTVRALDPIVIEPGMLVEYRGGMVLASRDRAFGSWSGIDFAADGTLYAIADDGHWMSLNPVEREGWLVGIDRPMVAPLLDDRGQASSNKRVVDAEGLRIIRRDGVELALVSFEQTPEVRIFDGPDFATARPRRTPVPREINNAPDNLGLEAIAVAPPGSALAGAIVVIAERFLDRNGNHRGYILDGPRAGTFALRRTSGFDVSDAAFLPDGDLLVLERKFSFPSGFSMRVRRIAAATIVPGAILDGLALLEGDARTGVDNMEGLAVRVAQDGTALLTLIADDNNSFLQRTVLLQFAVRPLPPLRPRLRPAGAAPAARS
jgi:hypothetical protein